MGAFEGFIVTVAFLYFLPSLIAISRWHYFGSVFAVNLFLGWTLIGWVIALSMSMSPRAKTTVQIVQQYPTTEIAEDRRPCPTCAEQILAQAKICHFCKHPTGFTESTG